MIVIWKIIEVIRFVWLKGEQKLSMITSAFRWREQMELMLQVQSIYKQHQCCDNKTLVCTTRTITNITAEQKRIINLW